MFCIRVQGRPPEDDNQVVETFGLMGSSFKKIILPPAFTLRYFQRGVADLIAYQDLLVSLSQHRVRVRYKQSVLGMAWAILQPLALMFIYTMLFSVFTRVVTQGPPYPVFVFCALMPWTFFSTSVGNSAASLTNHRELIAKVFFPREILPVTYVVAAVFDFLIAGVILAGMMIYYGVAPQAQLVWVVPVMLIAVVFSTGLSLLFSSLQVRFRDISLAMPLLMQLWMFASPVVYSIDAVPVRYRAWYALNPMAGVVENFRRAVLGHAPIDTESLAIAAAVSVSIFLASYLVFKYQEATMADTI
jgi:lipopolysaccharide transport system permease protein